MNDYDRNNLNFIMSLNGDEFEEWASGISDDDIEYAIELIQKARVEMVELQHDFIEEGLDENFTEANAILKKFML